MASDTKTSTASSADIASDMEHHRATYARFFDLLKYSSAAIAVVLVILFFALN